MIALDLSYPTIALMQLHSKEHNSNSGRCQQADAC